MSVIGSFRTKWIYVSMIVFAALIVGLSSFHSKLQIGDDTVPFTARYAETSVNPITGQTVQMPLLYMAVRSDGTISSGSMDPRLGYRRIRNRQHKVEVTVSDFLRIKTTLDHGYIPFTPPRRALRPDCRPRVEGVEAIGVRAVAGFRAYGYRMVRVLPDGSKREHVQWLAPDLGCWEIQQVTRRYDPKGTLEGVFEKKALEVELGDPDSSLFRVPEDYREVKPSERARAVHLLNVADREGSEMAAKHRIPLGVEARWAHEDEHYEAVANRSWNPAIADKK